MVLPARPSARFRHLALGSAALLGCTTVRAPVSTIAPEITVREGQAEPQVELWLEGNKPATPEESAQASAEAKAALDEALAGRVADNPDDLLVVREQGLTRTPGRRSDQRAAVAGVVIGAVVVVVATVILVVTSGSSKGGGKPPAVPGGAKASGGTPGVPAAPRTAVPAPTFRPTPPPPPLARGGVPAPPPRVAPVTPRPPAPLPGGARPLLPPPPGVAPSTTVGVYVGVDVPLGPAPSAAPEGYLNAQPPPERPPALDAAPPGAPLEAEPPEAEVPPAALDHLVLPPLPPLPVDGRGFWDGDTLHLEATVVDRVTGQPRWQKTVERKADPRDHAAVKDAVDALLADGGWVPAY